MIGMQQMATHMGIQMPQTPQVPTMLPPAVPPTSPSVVPVTLPPAEPAMSQPQSVVVPTIPPTPIQVMTYQFRDMSSDIPNFSGDNSTSVKYFLKQVEAIAQQSNWPEQHKISAALAKLKGPAKQWHHGFGHVNETWTSWKEAMIEQFGGPMDFTLWEHGMAEIQQREGQKIEHFVLAKCNYMRKCPLKLDVDKQLEYICQGITNYREKQNMRMLALNNLQDIIRHAKKADCRIATDLKFKAIEQANAAQQKQQAAKQTDNNSKNNNSNNGNNNNNGNNGNNGKKGKTGNNNQPAKGPLYTDRNGHKYHWINGQRQYIGKRYYRPNNRPNTQQQPTNPQQNSNPPNSNPQQNSNQHNSNPQTSFPVSNGRQHQQWNANNWNG